MELYGVALVTVPTATGTAVTGAADPKLPPMARLTLIVGAPPSCL